ncbi:CotH kinase family protein [Eisenbergiella porci]|uniref:CotH kinase family protein n=1 Tax=Eisenbergiella porci TaxID=2652274 RepID=UPI002A831846|nr:CotH kinase family protein [Eisenbergiella porci]
MNSRKIYTGLVVLLLLAALLLSRHIDPEKQRYQQHLSYNTQVEDTSLSIDEDTFSSHLPVVSIETGGVVIPGRPEQGQHIKDIENSFIQADMRIYDREGELNKLSSQPVLESKINIRVRGNSSRTFDKVGYLFKFTDDAGMERKLEVMGMEKDSTWVLHGLYLDKTLMRNYMWYNLAGQIMEWAPDVRYCEVFLDHEYQGLYVMAEQISMGEGRIEMTKYDGKSNISSYIVCADRESVNDVQYLDNFTSYALRINGKLEVKYPGASRITPELTEYISRDFSRFEKALYSFDYDTARYGYQNYIDVDSFVDYFIINEVTQNTDAGLYSTYFYKDVSGKLKMCVWDFNNCCDNYIEDQTPMAGFFMQHRPWYFMLCKDEAFMEKVITRYHQLRKGILSEEAVESYIAGVQSYLGPAIERNFEKWGYSFLPEKDLLYEDERKIGSYEAAVEQYETRLVRRMRWMDEHIEDLRSYSHESINKKFNH